MGSLWLSEMRFPRSQCLTDTACALRAFLVSEHGLEVCSWGITGILERDFVGPPRIVARAAFDRIDLRPRPFFPSFPRFSPFTISHFFPLSNHPSTV